MMRQPSYALLILADGEPMTVAKVAEIAKVTRKKAGDDMSALKFRGLLEIHEATHRSFSYVITPEGIAHLSRARADTKTSRILDAYISGESMTAREIESITGIDSKRVLNVNRRLEARGHLEYVRDPESRFIRMKITEAGRQEIAGQDIEPIVLDAETTIKSAMRTRPALEMVWGAMA